MDGIGNWIKKVRQEVELALSDSRPLPSAARLVADRVTLTLTFPALEGSTKNQLTIEFQVSQADLREAPAVAAEIMPVRGAPDEMRQLVIDAAAAVFGPGGV